MNSTPCTKSDFKATALRHKESEKERYRVKRPPFKDAKSATMKKPKNDPYRTGDRVKLKSGTVGTLVYRTKGLSYFFAPDNGSLQLIDAAQIERVEHAATN